ncbi:Thioesterase/thiol ester dehydrase-isomerase, partial [Ramicandelaber brevisporus]
DSLCMQKETMASIEASSLVAELRASPDYVNVPAYLPSKPEEKQHGFTTHTLSGPSKLIVSPVVFQHASPAATCILHLGRSLCGHYGIVHGGLVATVLDEMLARSAMPFLPGMTGFTANLNIDYRSPAVADQLVVARSWPMGPLEGRKIRVKAELRSLKDGKLLAEATSVFVTPKKV